MGLLMLSAIPLLLTAFVVCDNPLRAQDSPPPKLDDLFGARKPDAATRAPRSANSSTDAPQVAYLSFGYTQVYASPSEVWVFLDVDVHEAKQRGYDSRIGKKEFRVFVVDKGGLRCTPSTEDEGLTAHENFATFFRDRSQMSVYSRVTNKVYCWNEETADGPSFIECEKRKRELDISFGKPFETEQRLLKLSKAEAFKKVGSQVYGGSGPKEVFASKELGLRIWFEGAGQGRLGWTRVKVKYTKRQPPQEKLLLNLAL